MGGVLTNVVGIGQSEGFVKIFCLSLEATAVFVSESVGEFL